MYLIVGEKPEKFNNYRAERGFFAAFTA